MFSFIKNVRYSWKITVAGCALLFVPLTTVAAPPSPPKPNASDGTHSYGIRVRVLTVPNGKTYGYHVLRCLNTSVSSCDNSSSNYYEKYPSGPSGYIDFDVDGDPGKVYYFRSVACDTTGCSAPSQPDPGWRTNGSHQSTSKPTRPSRAIVERAGSRQPSPVARRFRLDEIRFVVPLHITHIHPAIASVVPLCRVFDSASQSNANEIGLKYAVIPVTMKNRNERQVVSQVSLKIVRGGNIHPGKTLDSVVSYNCTLYVREKGSNSLLSYSTTTANRRLRVRPPLVSVVSGKIDRTSVKGSRKATITVRAGKLRAHGG